MSAQNDQRGSSVRTSVVRIRDPSVIISEAEFNRLLNVENEFETKFRSAESRRQTLERDMETLKGNYSGLAQSIQTERGEHQRIVEDLQNQLTASNLEKFEIADSLRALQTANNLKEYESRIEALVLEVQTLNRTSSELSATAQSLQQERDTFETRIKNFEGNERKLAFVNERKLAFAEKELEKSASAKVELYESKIRTLESDLERNADSLVRQTAQYETKIQALESRLNSVLANWKPKDQTHADNYYCAQLGQLNQSILDITQRLSPPSMNDSKFLDHLSKILPDGQETADLLRNPPYKNGSLKEPRKVTAMIRHIITIVLVRDVFNPFAFGISPEGSVTLRKVENLVFSPEFDKVADPMEFRQALGRATLHIVRNCQPSQTVVETLRQSLSPFILKQADTVSIATKLREIVNKAVDIANEITVEYGMFQFFIGNSVTKNDCRSYDQSQSGEAVFCVFPGFRKKHMKSDWITLIYAYVERESGFRKSK